MQNKRLNIQLISVGATVTNLLNCAIASLTGPVGMAATQPYLLISQIRVTNNDTAAHTLNLYKGATGASAAGTELAKALSIPASSFMTIFYGSLRMDSGDFLTGSADTAAKLVLQIDAEIGFSG